MNINAGQIQNLLSARHHKDVYVPECKTGSTWMHKIVILDGWALKTSWAKPAVYGYEIKVHRSDFLRDEKWKEYLQYCTDFYFVCPPGLIKSDELPPEAGLLWCSANATMLYTKKRAPSRLDIKIPESLYWYILMSRTSIDVPREQQADRADEWRRWLEKKEIDRDLGYRVSKMLQQRINQEVVKARMENDELRKQNLRLAGVQGVLDKMGLRAYDLQWDAERKLQQRLDEAAGGFPQGFQRQLENTIQTLQNLLEGLRPPTVSQ